MSRASLIGLYFLELVVRTDKAFVQISTLGRPSVQLVGHIYICWYLLLCQYYTEELQAVARPDEILILQTITGLHHHHHQPGNTSGWADLFLVRPDSIPISDIQISREFCQGLKIMNRAEIWENWNPISPRIFFMGILYWWEARQRGFYDISNLNKNTLPISCLCRLPVMYWLTSLFLEIHSFWLLSVLASSLL